LLMMHRLKPKTDKNRFYLAPFDLYSMMSWTLHYSVNLRVN
jgi:hypothetical protein